MTLTQKQKKKRKINLNFEKPERKADKAHTEKSRLYVTEVIWYLQTFFLLSVFLSTVILGEIISAALQIVAMMMILIKEKSFARSG